MDPSLFDYTRCTSAAIGAPVTLGDVIKFYYPDTSFDVAADGVTITRWEWTKESTRSGIASLPSNQDVLLCYAAIVRGMPMTHLRQLRNKTLVQSDLYLLPDVPLTLESGQALCDWRKALRDLPQTVNAADLSLENYKSFIPQMPQVVTRKLATKYVYTRT